MLIACAMCGGTIEAALPLVAAGVAAVGAEVYNRARRAAYNRRAELAARLNARLDKLAAAPGSRSTTRPEYRAELARLAACDAGELSAS